MSDRPRAVLLDLGGVIMDINVAPLLAYWGQAAGVRSEQRMNRWRADDAYKRHETGDLDFAGYRAHLSGGLGIMLSDEDWLTGWNSIFVGPSPGVAARFPRIAERFDLCCYS